MALHKLAWMLLLLLGFFFAVASASIGRKHDAQLDEPWERSIEPKGDKGKAEEEDEDADEDDSEDEDEDEDDGKGEDEDDSKVEDDGEDKDEDKNEDDSEEKDQDEDDSDEDEDEEEEDESEDEHEDENDSDEDEDEDESKPDDDDESEDGDGHDGKEDDEHDGHDGHDGKGDGKEDDKEEELDDEDSINEADEDESNDDGHKDGDEDEDEEDEEEKGRPFLEKEFRKKLIEQRKELHKWFKEWLSVASFPQKEEEKGGALFCVDPATTTKNCTGEEAVLLLELEVDYDEDDVEENVEVTFQLEEGKVHWSVSLEDFIFEVEYELFVRSLNSTVEGTADVQVTAVVELVLIPENDEETPQRFTVTEMNVEIDQLVLTPHDEGSDDLLESFSDALQRRLKDAFEAAQEKKGLGKVWEKLADKPLKEFKEKHKRARFVIAEEDPSVVEEEEGRKQLMEKLEKAITKYLEAKGTGEYQVMVAEVKQLPNGKILMEVVIIKADGADGTFLSSFVPFPVFEAI
ncbi:FIK kinase [Balamuthia mandrillaris]